MIGFIIFLTIGDLFCATTASEYNISINHQKCDYMSNDIETCTSKLVTDYIEKAASGIPNLGLVPIDPLRIHKLEISQGDPKAPISLHIDIFDVSIFGYAKMKCNRLGGFTRNATEVQLDFVGTIPELNIQGKYVAKGSILILPIVGNGALNMTLSNIEFHGVFVTSVKMVDGIEYLDLDRVIVDFTATRMYFHLENLFNGDRFLGDTTNRFLNDNWRDVYSEMRPALAKTIAVMNKSVVKPVFDKIPYKELYENAIRV